MGKWFISERRVREGWRRVSFREKNELASAWILLSGKNADGEIKMILSVFNDLEGLLDLYPSVESHKTKAEKHGLNSLAMVEQIETKTKARVWVKQRI